MSSIPSAGAEGEARRDAALTILRARRPALVRDLARAWLAAHPLTPTD